jgi:hypothetical protein
LAVINAMIAREQECQDTHQQQQQQHQWQLQEQLSAAAQHHQPHSLMQQQQTDDTGSTTDNLQQWLSAASQQEHTLRMRALRLRFIDESKLAAALAEDAEDDGLESNSSPASQPDAQQHQQAPAHSPAQAAAAAVGDRGSGADGDSAVSSSGSQAAAKKRGRLRSSGRTPVRTIEQVMQEMQLPKSRCAVQRVGVQQANSKTCSGASALTCRPYFAGRCAVFAAHISFSGSGAQTRRYSLYPTLLAACKPMCAVGLQGA